MSFQTLVSNIWHKIVGFFQQDVVPEAIVIEKAFLAQFATPGGQLIFSAVTAFFSALTPGEKVSDIVSTGKTILSGLGTQELDLAGADASQVVLDAIRVHMSAASNAGTSAANPAPTVTGEPDDTETDTTAAQGVESGAGTSESVSAGTEAPAEGEAATEAENAASGA